MVVLVVNSIMMFVAFTTWTGIGEENANSYQQGLTFNDRLAEVDAQRAQGWQGQLDFTDLSGQRGRLELSLEDRFGNPLERAVVVAAVTRPTNAAEDFAAELRHVGTGRYGVDIAFPGAGQWDVRLVAEHPEGSYRLTDRVYVRP